MKADINKALIRRFYEEVWARGNVGFAEEVSQTTTSVMIFG